jgi:short-subunit dehydrogenase
VSSNILAGRVVILTGASSGIGAATAVACARRGMRLALAARREDLLRHVASQVEAAGAEALVCPTDVRRPDEIESLVEQTLARFERVDVLLANAGVGYSEPMTRVSDEQMVATIEVNLLGVLRCVRAVLPSMMAQQGGHIVTVSSVAAGLASPRGAVYAATKAGVHRFCEGLRREVRRHGIHVTDVLPGVIDTPMTERLTGVPKAPVAQAARAILAVMERPRPQVITPGWYRLPLALNRLAPWLMDAILARRTE